MQPDDIVIKNESLTVTVSPLGAEMRSVTDARGTERLWNGDPAYWTGRAPVLFPYAGGLKEDRYELDGKVYENCPKHGFAKVSRFTVEKADDTSAVFLLTEKTEFYPFDYAFRVSYALEGSSIRVSYSCTDTGTAPLYYSVGCHEAYAAPGGIEHYRLVFPEDESFMHSVLRGSQITKDLVPMAPDGKVLPLKEEQFTIDAMVFLSLRSRSVRLENDLNDDRVEISYPGHPYLLVWKKPQAPYVCVEPWVNPPSYTTDPIDLKAKRGIQRLEPGETRVHEHVIRFS